MKGIWPLVVAKVVIVVILCGLARWLGESEDRLTHFQVPHHYLSILAGTGQDMRHHPVPADRRDARALMMVGDARLVHHWLLNVLGDVLYEDLGTAASNEVLLVRVELNRGHRHSVVDVRGGHAPSAHLKVCGISSLEYLSRVPEGNGAIAHAFIHD